jgi:hypothetical protein
MRFEWEEQKWVKMAIFEGWMFRWMFIFQKVVVQKWVFRGGDTRRRRYCFFKDMCVFRADSPHLNAATF